MYELVKVWLLITEEIVPANPKKYKLKAGDKVIIQTYRNNKSVKVMGRVVTPNYLAEYSREKLRTIAQIMRIATPEDLAKDKENNEHALEARNYCKNLVKELKLNMKVFKAVYSLDKSLLLFLYTADKKVDFRELLKRLVAFYKKRIEMRQVGVRDEAKLISGLGACGMELCCHKYLYNFNQTGIKYAKKQHLSLNPEKVSGVCGRLRCCIYYEKDTYEQLNKGLPHEGKTIKYKGKDAKVLSVNVFTRMVSLDFADGGRREVKFEEEGR